MRKIFLIENNEAAIKMIQSTLNDFPDFHLEGISSDRDDSLNFILKHKPDIVFISLDKVFKKTLKFISEINTYSEDPPVFVALSERKKLAYQAIKLGVFDFILKPLKELDVRKSLLLYQKKHPSRSFQKICLKSYKDFQYIDTDEILFLKADNNSTDFHLKDGAVFSAFKTLGSFEYVLPENFLRIHKSYIINSDHVSRIQYGKSLCYMCKNKFHIPFTKTFIDNVELMNESLYKSSLLQLN